MLDLDMSLFPKRRDTVTGSFKALQAELLPNSEERITVAVVGRSAEGWYAAIVPNLEEFHCVFGDNALFMKHVAEDAVNYIHSLQPTKSNTDHASLQLPYTALKWSAWTREIEGNNWNDVAQVALAQSSVLCACSHVAAKQTFIAAFEYAAEKPIVVESKPYNITRNRLYKAVSSDISRRAPNLARYLRSNSPNASLDRPDYVGERSAAEFSVLRAQSLRTDLPDVQASLWRLDSFSQGQRQATAYVKTDNDVSAGEYGSLIKRVTEQAGVRRLRVVTMEDVEAITSDLLNVEVAA